MSESVKLEELSNNDLAYFKEVEFPLLMTADTASFYSGISKYFFNQNKDRFDYVDKGVISRDFYFTKESIDKFVKENKIDATSNKPFIKNKKGIKKNDLQK